jgi:hypothetical protein
MCIGSRFVTICLDALVSSDRETVVNTLKKSGLRIIDISLEQLTHFAGNMLELKDKNNKALIVLSKNAHNSLTSSQKKSLSNFGRLLPINIHTIETIAGGSARCMIAEIFCKHLIF